MTSEQYYQMFEVLKNIDKTLVEIRDLTFANGIKPTANENVTIGIDTGSRSGDFSVEIPLVKQEEKPLTKEELDNAWIDMKVKEMEANGIEMDANGVTVAEVKKRGRKPKENKNA